MREPAPQASRHPASALALIQRALLVGSTTDPAEREADAIADAVMAMTDAPAVDHDGAAVDGAVSSRVNRHGGGGGDLAGEFDPGASFEAGVQQVRRSGGQPLNDATRSFMEPRFGMSLDAVRVHSDERAQQLSASVGAQAFTLGTDIFLGQGARDDGSSGSNRLLAHELAHTVQQAPAAARRQAKSAYLRRHTLPMMEKPIVRRALTAIDPALGDRKWRSLATLVKGYNNAPLSQAKLETLKGIGEAVGSFTNPGFFGGIGNRARTRAAKGLANEVPRERTAVSEALMLKEAKSATATESWITKQAEKNIADRKDKKVGKLDLSKLAASIPGADFEAVADVFTQGKDEMKSSEELIEFGGRTGEAESNLGFMKKKGEVTITVNVPFKGEQGHEPTIQKAIDQYWNQFQAVYKGPLSKNTREVKGAKGKAMKVKVLEAPPPATGVVDMVFKLGKSSAPATKSGSPIVDSHTAAGTEAAKDVKERFAVKVVGTVFLFTKEHPNWQQRSHLGAGAKTRSDAANWRMDDAGVERMVAHEFGHLIGLDDEYSQTHSDIAKTTGKKSEKYDYVGDVPKLKSADQAAYDKILQGFKDSLNKPEGVGKAAAALKAVYDSDPQRFAFLSAHFYEHDSAGVKVAKHHFAKALEAFAKWHSPKAEKALTAAQAKVDNWGSATVKQKVTLKQDLEKARNLASELKKLADASNQGSAWMWYSGAGFRSGGLMGDYTTIKSGAPDNRYNAIAHDHKHPLEPRHMKRFVDMLGAARGEKWEAKHKS